MSTNTALDQIKARVEGHSATPWQVEPYLHSMYDRVRVTSPDDGPDFNTAEDVLPADAELIAAAPKLLAALEAVEEVADAEVQKQRKETERQWARLKSRHPDSDYKTADRQEASTAGAERVANLIRRAIEEALR